MSKTFDMIKRHEGFRPRPYTCSEGRLTIGYGTNLDKGIAEAQAAAMARWRMNKIKGILARRIDFFRLLEEPRQAALIDMAYQLGVWGLLRFKKMLAALERRDYETARAEALDSQWAAQTPERAEEIADMLLTGEWI